MIYYYIRSLASSFPVLKVTLKSHCLDRFSMTKEVSVVNDVIIIIYEFLFNLIILNCCFYAKHFKCYINKLKKSTNIAFRPYP